MEKKLTGNEPVSPFEKGRYPGMTLRQYYAGLNMAALINDWTGTDADHAEAAKRSVNAADQLIKALNDNPVKE